MGKDRKQVGNNIDPSLDQFNEGQGVIVGRIHGTLQIDSEHPPTRDQVAQEVGKLHGRTRKRRIDSKGRHS